MYGRASTMKTNRWSKKGVKGIFLEREDTAIGIVTVLQSSSIYVETTSCQQNPGR